MAAPFKIKSGGGPGRNDAEGRRSARAVPERARFCRSLTIKQRCYSGGIDPAQNTSITVQFARWNACKNSLDRSRRFADIGRVAGKQRCISSRVAEAIASRCSFKLWQKACRMSAFAVAFGCKADMAYCSAHVRF
jgi:hypothetical protein